MSVMAKNQDLRRPLATLAAVVLALALSLSCLRTVAKADDTSSSSTVRIDYDSKTDIHSVTDPDGTKIILYCMNNLLKWPHTTPSTSSVPDYTDTPDYLTPSMFGSQQQYEECMERLLAILYAGYPYNGLHLYEVTDQGKQITEGEFNQMLDAPDVLRQDFPDSLGSTTFTYADFTNGNKDNIDKLYQFMLEVGALYPNGTSASGLTYQEIIATNFYNAASAMVYGTKDTTPLQYWNEQYADDTLVTESQAYKATRDAIWVLLQEYGVPSNNLTRKSLDVVQNPLSLRLLDGANANEVLRTEPQASALGFSGNTQFAYDPATKTWRTGLLTITEGEKYNGLYTLSLPDGVTAVDEEGNDISSTSIRAGRGFYLVSATKPAESATVSASATLTWLKETRQYSPVGSTEFQHMIGALIYTKEVSTSTTTKPATEGSLSVTKNVEGEENSTAAFKFTVTLSDASVNGAYGDMEFANGVATFELHNGEAAVAEHLPAGVTYTVSEEANDAYTAAWDGATGSIVADKTVAATCTNTLKPTPAEPSESDGATDDTKTASDDNTAEDKPAPKQPAAMPDTGDSTNYASIAGLAVAGVAALGIALVWGGRSGRRHGDHLQ